MQIRTRSLRAGAVALLGGLLALTLAAPVDAAVQDLTEATPKIEPHQPDPVAPVPVTKVPVVPVPASESQQQPRHPKAAWPASYRGVVDLARPAGKQGPVQVMAGALRLGSARTGSTPGRVAAQVLDRTASQRLGVAGVALRLRRADGLDGTGTVSVALDYGSFAGAFGGDWAQRLRLVALSPGGQATPLPSRNDADRSVVTGEVSLTSADQTFAVTATESGSTGDYKATSLAPSGNWAVSAQSGGFSWSYNFRVPPVPGGLVPQLAASYDSSSVDGRTVSTNNQPSWLGEGWSLWPGFVEHSYQGCANDLGGNNEQTKTGDLCWETENATLSFGSHSGRLVLENGTWRPAKDDGTKVERLSGAANGDNNGEHWKVTSTDGTQYVFGARTDSAWNVPVFGNDPGEPCRQTTFAASACTQTYRWNLDSVTDAHGNTITYHYTTETNRYAQNLGATTATYTRGGMLERIEYGARTGQSGPAPARVVLTPADRCVPGKNCAVRDGVAWPDVPWDADCSATACTGKYAPTFWSTKRLAGITTQIASGGGAYTDVESWTLTHGFPAPGDGTSAALWLESIGHRAGSLTLPAVTLGGSTRPNRVNTPTDGLPAMNKYRIDAVNTESGGTTNVHYAAPDCAPGALPAAADTNTKRCFPARWAMPPSTTPVNDWFHKYVVAQVSQVDRVGGGRTQFTDYVYAGGAAWAYDDNPLVPADRRTWSQWRGYGKVLVRSGDAAGEPDKPRSETEYLYLRGMHGDKLAAGGTKSVIVTDSAGGLVTDLEPYAGVEREHLVRNGAGGAFVSSQINTPWHRKTATQGTYEAHQVELVRSTQRIALAAGGVRTTEVETTYDEHGNPVRVHDKGDTGPTTDDTCTTTSYLKNPAVWLMSLVAETKAVAVPCGTTPSYPGDAISAARTSYDGGAPDAVPVKGDVSRTEVAKAYEAGVPIYQTTARTIHDDRGRPKESFDAAGQRTLMSYTETNGLSTTVTVTNPLGHVTTTGFEPRYGQKAWSVDANGRRTDLSRDALGRLTGVWNPGRSKELGDGPQVRYAYGMPGDGPSWVRTETLKAGGNYVTGYELMDGFLRKRQTQTPSPKGGRILTDTTYDSRGLVDRTRAAYYDVTSAPSGVLHTPDETKVPNSTRSVFDGAERQTATIQLKLGVEQWRTTTTFGGDRVTVTPPNGGTTETTLTDARGQKTELRQHKPGGYDSTRYDYNKAGALREVIDAAGNKWSYEHDVLGRMVRSIDPDKGTSTMSYDELGRLRTLTDGRGKTLVSVYDALGRRVESRLESTTGPLVASWTYDTLAKGVLTSATRYEGTNAYVKAVTGIDAAGRPTGEKLTIPASETGLAGSYSTSMEYRADGSVSSVALPALGDLPAETLVHDYDALGRPETLNGAAPYVTGTTYNELGEKTQRSLGALGNRMWQTSYYDQGTRRIARVLTERERAGQTFAADEVYDYDPAGNLVRTANLVAGSATDTQCFKYDHLRRVKDVWTATDNCAGAPATGVLGGPAPYWQTYDYDAAGNRSSLTHHGVGGAASTTLKYNYPAAGSARPHAVTSIEGGSTGVRNYKYDDAGNMTNRPGPGGEQILDWSNDGTLGSITSAGKPTSYLYDANGTQLIRKDPGKVTLFVAGGEITYDTTTRTKVGMRYYDGVGVRTSAGVQWLIADRQNTAKVAIDAKTLTVSVRRMDLFGNPRGTTSTWTGGARGYVAGVENATTGLTRLGVREYDAATGMFLSVDPIIDPNTPQQLNAYAYGNHNPATWSDPSGLRADYDDCRCNYNGYPPPRVYGPHQREVASCKAGLGCGRPAQPKVWHPPMKILHGERGARGQQQYAERQWKRHLADVRAKEEQHRRNWEARDQKVKGELTKTLGVGADPREEAAINKAIEDFKSQSFRGWVWSVSFCVEMAGGFILGGATDVCVNIDQFGMARSESTKFGLHLGLDASRDVVIKLNTEGATEVGSKEGQASIAISPQGGLLAHGGFELEAEIPFNGTSGGSVAAKFGAGAGASVGGIYGTVHARNHGYFHLW